MLTRTVSALKTLQDTAQFKVDRMHIAINTATETSTYSHLVIAAIMKHTVECNNDYNIHDNT